MVRPLKMAVLLPTIQPMPDQCLLHLHLSHQIDLPTYLPRAQLVIGLIKGVMRVVSLCWFPC